LVHLTDSIPKGYNWEGQVNLPISVTHFFGYYEISFDNIYWKSACHSPNQTGFIVNMVAQETMSQGSYFRLIGIGY